MFILHFRKEQLISYASISLNTLRKISEMYIIFIFHNIYNAPREL